MDSGEDSQPVWPPAPEPIELPWIEFTFEALPYSIGKTRLSDFRAGSIILKQGKLLISGRASLPERKRILIYALSGLAFLPGVFLAYVLMERAPWDRVYLSIDEHDIVLFSHRDDYRLISIMYNLPDRAGRVRPRTLTFQSKPDQYRPLMERITAYFPDKIWDQRLRARLTHGAQYAWIGVLLWSIYLAIAWGGRR